MKVSHSYANTGYYVITLTVTDDAGAVGTARHAVNVQEKSSGVGVPVARAAVRTSHSR